MKEDAPDSQVSRLKAQLDKKKKKERKKEKGKKGRMLMERDIRLARLRRERRMEATAKGIPLSEVESPTEEDLSRGGEDEGDADDDDDEDEEMAACLGVPSPPRF